ncbi:hypothetical protein N9H93_06020 [Rhizobiaceae bacterium]|nr:hypothetical protein [Rhizobiaceae bacterium]
MSLQRFSMAALILLTSTGTVSASPLTGAEVREAIAGKNVRLATRWGSFPLRYGTNGSVTGDGEALGLAKFFSPKETGRWSVEGNRLCQTFPTWYDGATNCFTLTRTGPAALNWTRDDGYSGTATISN